MREQYRLTKEIFIERANKIHDGKYNYDEVIYENQRKKVKIICPIHGPFMQTPKNHMNGQGCPVCGKKYAQTYSKNNYQRFIEESLKRFGDRYEFPNIAEEYINSNSKITIKCKECGNTFTKIACDHMTSPHGGCQHCHHSRSKPEEEIGEFIKTCLNNETEISFNVRDVIKNNEIDIYVPSEHLAIEYNGLYWHSNKDKYYHLSKTESCETMGIKLLQIFEDEYTNKKNIVLSKIKHMLHKDYDLPKIYARQCSIKEIKYQESLDFLTKNHIQGGSHSTLYLGCYKNEELVSVMTFNKLNGNLWELTRFANNINYRVIGAAGKLFKYFVKKEKPLMVKSFADRRWTSKIEDNLYTKLNFTLDKITLPDYKYFLNGSNTRIHKFNFRKKILNKKYGLALTMTENEMAEQLNAKKIWDCGLLRYIWIRKDE